MMLTRARRTVLVVLALVLVPGAAYAGTWTRADPRGDVRLLVGVEYDAAIYEPDPDDQTADITRVRVTHDARRVRIDVSVRDLVRAGNKDLTARLLVPGKKVLARGSQNEYAAGSVLLDALGGGFDAPPLCPPAARPTVRFRPGKDLARLVVPRSCLGDPAWVRVGVEFATFTDDGYVPGDHHLTDQVPVGRRVRPGL
jgi:hypothetical protein